MTIRKNFVLNNEVAQHLEELAIYENRSMTSLIQEMIEERYKSIEKAKKLEAFYSGLGSATGMVGDKSVQQIKGETDV